MKSLKFGVDSTPPSRNGLAALLQSCGLTLVEQHTAGQETLERAVALRKQWPYAALLLTLAGAVTIAAGIYCLCTDSDSSGRRRDALGAEFS